jgi:hypothetical protein
MPFSKHFCFELARLVTRGDFINFSHKEIFRYSKNKTGHVRTRNKVRSRNHWYHGKALSITYSEGVSVALDTQHAKHMHHIVICCLSGSTIFFHISSS